MRYLWPCACLLVAAAGCGKPEQIGPDPEAFKAVDALFTAVTAKRPDLLEACEKHLGELRERGRLPAKAHGELAGIIDRARAGRWEPAAETLRRFMRGQEKVRVGRGDHSGSRKKASPPNSRG
jgi:hypothetical protein